MTVKCTFCNDTKQEPGIPGPCVWCEQVGAAPVAVGYQLAKGFTDPVGDCEKFEAGITVNSWLQRIVVYGDSPADAEALRDHIMASAEREAALREELDRHKSLYNQLEKALSRVHCMYGKRLLDLTGERQTVLVPDEEFVKYFEELKCLKFENSALQQRLTVAEQLLRETLPHLRFCKGMGRKFAEKLDGLDLRIEAVLKPASGCEHSFHYFGDYPRRRCNNCNALEVVAEGEGS